LTVPMSDNVIEFYVGGPGEIVATDNGNPADMIPFPSHNRNAFSGMALAIVRFKHGMSRTIEVTAESKGLKAARVRIRGK
jgi:beta-galactosidase